MFKCFVRLLWWLCLKSIWRGGRKNRFTTTTDDDDADDNEDGVVIKQDERTINGISHFNAI